MKVQIAASLLAADFSNLARDIATAERGGADMLHFDVMDGHFVPNISMGPPVLKAVRRVATVPIDVHLMIEDPDTYIESFAKAGASQIAVHVEVLPHLHRTIHYIKGFGVSAGAAINPATPVTALEEIAVDLDFVLVMSVNPGFGGQTFIPQTESKVRAIRHLLDRAGSRAFIEVDGGVDTTNAARLVAAGVNVLVAGTTIFGAADPERATRDLRDAALAPAGHRV